jgi:hypothetical protein
MYLTNESRSYRATPLSLVTACFLASVALESKSSRVPDDRLPNVVVDATGDQITSRQRDLVSIALMNSNSIQHCRAEMSIRGSSSAKHPKKPYRLELQDENGEDLKLSLLGMPKESDWILYPAYLDKTMIRDVLAYELWRQMGYWAPRTRYVHLFIYSNAVSKAVTAEVEQKDAKGTKEKPDFGSEKYQGANSGLKSGTGEVVQKDAKGTKGKVDFGSREYQQKDAKGAKEKLDFRREEYQGVYVLMEKIKRGKHRVNIEKLPRGSPPTDNGPLTTDLTGGYIFKKDRHNNTNETHFRTTKKIDILIEEPKVRDLASDQLAWFTNHMNEFEAVLFSDYFADPTIGYTRYVNIDSFVDYHWMQELGKNGDGYWFSEFYHKDRGGKINIGPIWDCDLYFGNTWYNDGFKTNGWRWERSGGNHYTWYKRMFKDPGFLQRYIDRWSELRGSVLSDSNILSLIDRFAAEIAEAQKINYQRWPTLGKKVGPVYFVGQTWEEEVEWLKDWMIGRLAWIDSQDFPKPVLQVIQPLLTASVGASSIPTSLGSRSSVEKDLASSLQTSALSMTCSVGSIFYTTNNTDPRVSGGHASTNTLHYTGPIPITPGLQIRARVMSDYGLWSAPALYP